MHQRNNGVLFLRNAGRLLLTALCLLAVFTPAAYADWYDEVTSGSYTEIEGSRFVADTFCGVEALYSETSEEYQCNELIMRFYADAYGLDVMAYSNTGLIMLSEGYRFVTPSQPKKGDVIYSPAKFRKNRGDHWAIVKDYSDGKITLFEQNVVWEGKAGTGRTLNYPSNYYYLYSPQAERGYPAPVLKGAPAETTTAKPTTTKPTTTKPTTTTKPATTTTKPATTTTKSVTTTTKPVTTTTKPAATTTPATTTPVTTTPVTRATNPTTAAAEAATTATIRAAQATAQMQTVTERQPAGSHQAGILAASAAAAAVILAGGIIFIRKKGRR